MSEFETARQNMVDGQLRPTKVTDRRVLEVMGALPREMFVEKSLQGIAYVDEDIEVAPGRYLMEPVVLARLVQALELTRSNSVLVIGAATGYDSALIGSMAGPVVVVESSVELAEKASIVINHLGIDNVAVVVGALPLLHRGRGKLRSGSGASARPPRRGDEISEMPRELRRRMMYAYLGFPFYDVATLPILGMRGMNEFEPSVSG